MGMLVDQVADLPDVPLARPAGPRFRRTIDRVTAWISWKMWLETSTVRPWRPHSMIDVDQLAAGDRVGARERLVEEEHERVVHHRLGQLDPLPHPLRIAADRPAGVLGHPHQLERPLGRLTRPATAQAAEQCAGRQELAARHPLEERVLLGAEPDVTVQARTIPRADGPAPAPSPWLGRSWPVASCNSVLLPDPFGPSRPVTPAGSRSDRLFRPITWPYHFDTERNSMTAGLVSSRSCRIPTPGFAGCTERRLVRDERESDGHDRKAWTRFRDRERKERTWIVAVSVRESIRWIDWIRVELVDLVTIAFRGDPFGRFRSTASGSPEPVEAADSRREDGDRGHREAGEHPGRPLPGIRGRCQWRPALPGRTSGTRLSSRRMGTEAGAAARPETGPPRPGPERPHASGPAGLAPALEEARHLVPGRAGVEQGVADPVQVVGVGDQRAPLGPDGPLQDARGHVADDPESQPHRAHVSRVPRQRGEGQHQQARPRPRRSRRRPARPAAAGRCRGPRSDRG